MPRSGAQASGSTTARLYRRTSGGGGCFSWRPSDCAASSPSRSALTNRLSALPFSGPSRRASPKTPQASTSSLAQGLTCRSARRSLPRPCSGSRPIGSAPSLIALNLFLYTTIGFKYRIVVTLIGVFGVRAATRPRKSRPAQRSQRMKVVLAGVVVTTVAFFVVQVYRGNHESGRVVTASSFDVGRLEGIATSSIDIATPYAAIHQQHFGLLLGESYLQLPRLFVPQVIWGHKGTPAMWSVIQAVTVPGTGAAVPLWAEADANFGLIGLLGFGAILGWVVSRSDTADRRRMETAAMTAATGAVLASVLSRSLMFFALYEFAAIVLPIWTISRRGAGERLK